MESPPPGDRAASCLMSFPGYRAGARVWSTPGSPAASRVSSLRAAIARAEAKPGLGTAGIIRVRIAAGCPPGCICVIQPPIDGLDIAAAAIPGTRLAGPAGRCGTCLPAGTKLPCPGAVAAISPSAGIRGPGAGLHASAGKAARMKTAKAESCPGINASAIAWPLPGVCREKE